jgi:hypothetical protein
MKKENILKAIDEYEAFFNMMMPLGPEMYATNKFLVDLEGAKQKHLRWMIKEIRTMLEEDEENLPRASAFFNFIQGIMWRDSLYTIDDLARHSVGICEGIKTACEKAPVW